MITSTDNINGFVKTKSSRNANKKSRVKIKESCASKSKMNKKCKK